MNRVWLTALHKHMKYCVAKLRVQTKSSDDKHMTSTRGIIKQKWVREYTEGPFMACTWLGEVFAAVAYQFCATCLQHSRNHVQAMKRCPVQS